MQSQRFFVFHSDKIKIELKKYQQQQKTNCINTTRNQHFFKQKEFKNLAESTNMLAKKLEAQTNKDLDFTDMVNLAYTLKGGKTSSMISLIPTQKQRNSRTMKLMMKMDCRNSVKQ